MKDGKEVPNCVPERKENVKLYLSKDLLDYDKPLYPKSKKRYKEIDMDKVKQGIVTGAMVGASLFPSSKDASSDYFRMINTNVNNIQQQTKGLSIEEQIRVYEDALKRISDNSDRSRINNILKDLKTKVKNKQLAKGIITRESKLRKQELDEMNWKDVKDFSNKVIAGTLLVSASFMPIAQSLYGNDSCSIDSSGEIVSCDASKLKSKISPTQILITIKSGINIIKENIDDSDYRQFAMGEIEAVIKGLNDLNKRPNLTDKERLEIQNQLKEILEIQNQLKNKLKSIKKGK